MNTRTAQLIAALILAVPLATATYAATRGEAAQPEAPSAAQLLDPHASAGPMAEDGPGWNCLTMGNRLCGPAYVPVTQELADALVEGDAPDATTRDWESCLVRYADTTVVVCPDGYTETS